MQITVHSWKAAEGLTPVAGMKVVIKNRITGGVEGEFQWVQSWNPVAMEYQLYRA